jgi:glycosyltransferase involved in cell wall biosynthesis
MAPRLVRTLINNKDREYYIVTSTHSSNTDPNSLLSYPDKLILVSEWSKQKFEKALDIPCGVWEYPIEDLTPNKNKFREELNFDPNFKHVLNIGLFTSGKNQGELFEIAKSLKDKPIKFHFVGNQAP